MARFCECPRCGTKSMEKLNSYAHCVECLYFEDYWESPESDYFEAKKTLEELDRSLGKRPKRDNVSEILTNDNSESTEDLKGA